VTLLHEGVARHALERPARIALRDGDAQLSYADLDREAARFARRLADRGVGHGDTVAIALTKSWQAIAAIHGVLRCGAAYVPVDPKSPTPWNALVISDAGCRVAIAEPGPWGVLQASDRDLGGVALIVPPSQADASVDLCGQPVDRAVVETDVAYILYTSGTTGRPKGVEVTHRNAVAFVEWAVGALGLDENDVHSQHAPLRFDLSVLDLFAAAHTGATVALVPERAALFPGELAAWIRREGITVWYSVPTALSLLVRSGHADDGFPDLRLVLFAGEVFNPTHLQALMSRVPHATFANLYGPTETNVCTYHVVTTPPDGGGDPTPIGRPCEHTRAHVIDDDGTETAAVGERGELVICGPTVARGYRGDVPAGGFQGAGTYRTGDIVEILEAGARPVLRYLGRRDTMVKVRGYRVELGEIETALHAVPGVDHAVVVAVPDDALGTALVAFCVATSDTTDEVLRRACRDRLPRYMVPQRFHFVDEMPATGTGKTDRVALTQLASHQLADAR